MVHCSENRHTYINLQFSPKIINTNDVYLHVDLPFYSRNRDATIRSKTLPMSIHWQSFRTNEDTSYFVSNLSNENITRIMKTNSNLTNILGATSKVNFTIINITC